MPHYVSENKLWKTLDIKSFPFMPLHEFVLTLKQTFTYINTYYVDSVLYPVKIYHLYLFDKMLTGQ